MAAEKKKNRACGTRRMLRRTLIILAVLAAALEQRRLELRQSAMDLPSWCRMRKAGLRKRL